MAILLMALGASLQVPVIESFTHDTHHSRNELYAFSAEIEECLEEDRAEFHPAFKIAEGDIIALVRQSYLNGLRDCASTASALAYQEHAYLTPFNRKIYLLCGRRSSPLPKA